MRPTAPSGSSTCTTSSGPRSCEQTNARLRACSSAGCAGAIHGGRNRKGGGAPLRGCLRASTFPARARAIRLLALDVDGVLTDGRLVYGPTGEELKVFQVQDGLAIQAAQHAGLLVAVISSRASPAVSRRMADLGVVEVHQGARDKAAVLDGLLRRRGVALRESAYMGDDLPDLPLLSRVGLALAPSNAAAEVKRVAHWVGRRSGGTGAVREAVEAILKARRAWPPA
ncbi:MAG: HAD hydrolase family protein [Candidatus Rokubacteria bacterium]|nr:HAD hydrolase family protein [Candidatus Rokubacteria bacterium]